MFKLMKLAPYERLLIESGINHYKLVGPGLVWLGPGQRVRTRFSIRLRPQILTFTEVNTAEKVPVEVKVHVLYRVDPELLTETLLPSLDILNEIGWEGSLQWQLEYVLRQLLANHTWFDLGREETQPRLERRLTQTLAERVKVVGLNVVSVCLIKVALPAHLQRAIVQAERDRAEARGRAEVLKAYREIFGSDLSRAMPHIIRWELMNTLRKNEQTQLLLTNTDLLPSPVGGPSILQMGLPLFQGN